VSAILEPPIPKSWLGQRNMARLCLRTIWISAVLALTQAEGPSVIQVRTHDVSPSAIGELMVNALRQFQRELEQGALIVLDETHVRARILPLTN
jgi:hypothetical protein